MSIAAAGQVGEAGGGAGAQEADAQRAGPSAPVRPTSPAPRPGSTAVMDRPSVGREPTGRAQTVEEQGQAPELSGHNVPPRLRAPSGDGRAVGECRLTPVRRISWTDGGPDPGDGR